MKEKNKELKDNSFGFCAHHRKGHIDYYQHTIRICIRDKEIRLCARCTGIYLSLTVSIIIEAVYGYWFLGNSLDPIFSLTLAVILALPLLIDWGTQKVDIRVSNNYLRVFTGLLFGIGLSFIQFTQEIFFWTIIIMISYALTMLLLIQIKNRSKRILN